MGQSEGTRAHGVEPRASTHRPSVRMAVVADTGSRAGDWLRRYGMAELLGIVGALLSAYLAKNAELPLVAVGYAGAIGENVGFYSTIVVRQVAADRRLALDAGERYRARQLWCTGRELLLEFGPAELFDSLVMRPFAMGFGVRMLGHPVGVVIGKLVADVTFYLPVILTYETRRRARKHSHP
jgi:hypothetical protein